MGKYDLPPASRVPKNLNFPVLPIYGVEEYGVGSWCPLPDGQGPATQVHLHFRIRGIPERLVMRFKSAAELDRFIEALKRHRYDVWPG
jgi:hypothetical protein